MGKEQWLLERTVEEYEAVFNTGGRGSALEWGEVELLLERDLAWTHEGACEISRLAREYGAFMMRNALAVATVLGIEDGELTY
ncbi:MAG: hypothetical protein ACYTBJ_18760 [Planctomycetota bacterium]|jgi:hypothetical protein